MNSSIPSTRKPILILDSHQLSWKNEQSFPLPRNASTSYHPNAPVNWSIYQISTKERMMRFTRPKSNQSQFKDIQRGKLCTSATRRRRVLHPNDLLQTSPSTICKSKTGNRYKNAEVRSNQGSEGVQGMNKIGNEPIETIVICSPEISTRRCCRSGAFTLSLDSH